MTTIPVEAYNTELVVPRLVNAKIGEKLKLEKHHRNRTIQVFIDTRTNFEYILTKAYSQEVIGGTLVKYQPNLSKRSRRTKAMFTIGGRVLNDIVVQIVPESKNAVSSI